MMKTITSQYFVTSKFTWIFHVFLPLQSYAVMSTFFIYTYFTEEKKGSPDASIQHNILLDPNQMPERTYIMELFFWSCNPQISYLGDFDLSYFPFLQVYWCTFLTYNQWSICTNVIELRHLTSSFSVSALMNNINFWKKIELVGVDWFSKPSTENPNKQ